MSGQRRKRQVGFCSVSRQLLCKNGHPHAASAKMIQRALGSCFLLPKPCEWVVRCLWLQGTRNLTRRGLLPPFSYLQVQWRKVLSRGGRSFRAASELRTAIEAILPLTPSLELCFFVLLLGVLWSAGYSRYHNNIQR